MTHRIEVSPAAARQLKKIDQRLRDSDVDFLRGLIDPERGGAEPER